MFLQRLNSIVFKGFQVLALVAFAEQVFSQRVAVRIAFADFPQSLTCRVKANLNDTVTFVRMVNGCLTSFHSKGYVSARFDSIDYSTIPITVFGVRGELYEWGSLQPDSLTNLLLQKQGIQLNKFNGKTLETNELIASVEKSIRMFENNGYPFASFTFNNSEISKSRVNSSVAVQPGLFVAFDTLYINGSAKVSHSYLSAFLGLQRGKPYSERKVNAIDNNLRGLPFVSIIKPSEVEFIPGKARTYVYLSSRRASRFSGLIGFSSNQNSSRGILLTGNLNLLLVNTLKNAESLSLLWNALGNSSQSLKTSCTWPYIFGTKAAFEGSFVLYKRDSSYLNLNPSASLSFIIRSGMKVGIGVNHKSSKTLSLQENNRLAGFSSTLANLVCSYSNLTAEFLPSRGMSFYSSFGVGNRGVDENGVTPAKQKSSILEVSTSTNFYFPLYREQIILHINAKAEKLAKLRQGDSEIPFMDNEKYRIGGFQSLRGFNDESILTDGYVLLASELHLKISRAVSTFLLYDNSYIENYAEIITRSWASALGAGFSLDGKGGVLNLSYALGKGLGQSFSFRDAKLHVGYTATF